MSAVRVADLCDAINMDFISVSPVSFMVCRKGRVFAPKYLQPGLQRHKRGNIEG